MFSEALKQRLGVAKSIASVAGSVIKHEAQPFLDILHGNTPLQHSIASKQGDTFKYGVAGEKLSDPKVKAEFNALPASKQAEYKAAFQSRISNIAGVTGNIEGPTEAAAKVGKSLFSKAADLLRGKTPEVPPATEVPTVKKAVDILRPKVTQVADQVAKKGVLERIKETAPVRAFTEQGKILEQFGPGGKKAKSLIDSTFRDAEVNAGKDLANIVEPLKKFTAKEKENFVLVTEGKASALNSKVDELATNFRQRADSIAYRADVTLPFSAGYRQDYFPRKLNLDYIKNKVNGTKIIDHLVQSGQAQDAGEARVILMKMRDGVKQISGSLERSRTEFLDKALPDLPSDAYELDPVKALTRYFIEAHTRLETAQNFGPNGEKIDSLLSQIAREGGDYESASKVIKNILNPDEGGFLAKAQRPLTKFESGTKLATAFISNAAQSTNTVASHGLRNTIKAFGNLLTQGGREAVMEKSVGSGVLNESALSESLGKDYNGIVSKLPWIKAFGGVEKFNRVLASTASWNGAESAAQKLLKKPEDKFARRILSEKYGLDPEKIIKEGKVAVDDLLRAANKGTETTQFRTRNQDLPETLTNPNLKVLTQFKNFAFKQTQYISNELVKEAVVHKNPAPLVRFLIVGTILGEGVNTAKYGVKNIGNSIAGNPKEERPAGTTDRILEDLSAVGGAGVVGDAYKALKGGTYTTMRWILGPGLGDATQLGSNVVRGDVKGVEQQALQAVPYVGRPLTSKQKTKSSSSNSSGKLPVYSGSSSTKSTNTKLPLYLK
jgi:hypothetical protein